jgi:hypothetical protein
MNKKTTAIASQQCLMPIEQSAIGTSNGTFDQIGCLVTPSGRKCIADAKERNFYGVYEGQYSIKTGVRSQ